MSDLFPWVNPWRQELRELLDSFPVSRSPALRRSLKDDYLFASDLPACVPEDACRQFLSRAGDTGWETEQEAGWIHFRRTDDSRPAGWFPEEMSGEAGCLRRLILLHPGGGEARREAIRLMKAREEGPESWEKTCRALHQDFARRVREKEPLPNLFGKECTAC